MGAEGYGPASWPGGPVDKATLMMARIIDVFRGGHETRRSGVAQRLRGTILPCAVEKRYLSQ